MAESKVTKEKLVEFIDEKVKLINDSQRWNFIRWDILKLKRSKQPAK